MKRWILIGIGLVMIGASLGRAEPKFDFGTVRARAQQLAAKPYEPHPNRLPDWLMKLSYDQYRDIRFVPVESWWNREAVPYKLQFFHPGWIFNRTVQVHEVAGGEVYPIVFSKRFFDYGHNHIGSLPDWIGFAGFRILYPLNQPGDELGAFQGASYFRFLCRTSVYGLSARGIAVNAGEPSGEEFPDFEEFWVERPGTDAKQIVVYALLDGPTVTGAYRFAVTPGDDTAIRVRAAVYCRKNPAVLGIAPLTSMFWHGKNTNFETDDLRPEVHDSDGLMLNTGTGEWMWRPLTNPPAMRTMAFMDDNPLGFGLLQRERHFECYEDLEVAYQRRPSAWVEPIGKWGRGSVRLLELHSGDETSDNIVAYWVPEKLPPPGSPIELEYNLHWFIDQIHPPGGYTVATRHGRTRTFETDLERFVIDFDGPKLRGMEADSGIETAVTVGHGATLMNATAQKNPYDGTWRAAFAFRPDGSGKPVELRCYLRRSSRVLSETWSYLWQP